MTAYHKETNMGLHVCNICHDEFVSGTYLRKHIFKAHEADRSSWPFKCNYCGKGFTNAPGLYLYLIHSESTTSTVALPKSTRSAHSMQLGRNIMVLFRPPQYLY